MSKKKPHTTQKDRRERIKTLLIENPGLPNRSIARTVGVSHTTVGIVRAELEAEGRIGRIGTTEMTDWMSHPLIMQNPKILEGLDERGLRTIKKEKVMDIMLERGLTSPRYAQRLLNLEKKATRKTVAGNMTLADVTLKQGDLYTGLPWIEDNSIDLIVTDLPYSREYVSLYSALSKLAGRVLKDGGSLLCMTGHSALPAFINALCEDERLRYHWTISVVMPRKSPPLHWLNVSTYWKPIFHLCKNSSYKGDLYSDLINAKPSDKERDIPWEQPQDVFDVLVDRFVPSAGLTILDPCCGSGTSLISGLKAGCKVIGVDVDSVAIKAAKKRINAYFEGEE